MPVKKYDRQLKGLLPLPIHNKSDNVLLRHIGKLFSKYIFQSYQPKEQITKGTHQYIIINDLIC